MTTRQARLACSTMSGRLSRRSRLLFLVVFTALACGCLRRPVSNPNVIVVAVVSAPNNLDPRVAADDVSQKAAQLIYNGLMTFDEHLRAVPDVAERLDNPEPTEYIATLRRGVRFHDGHELTSADVVYTFTSLLEPGFVSPYKGAFQLLASVEALGRYAVRFRRASCCRKSSRTAPAPAFASTRLERAPTDSSSTPWTTISNWPRSTGTFAATPATTASC
jgi:ABC-type transport system substrate-binding protein